VSPFYIYDNGSSVQLHGICVFVGFLHVILSLVFDESISPGLGRFVSVLRIAVGITFKYELEILDWAVCLELAQKLSFSGFISQSAHKECVVTVHSLEVSLGSFPLFHVLFN